jgi:DNA uptake protein ComE-like DNA-binding protein
LFVSDLSRLPLTAKRSERLASCPFFFVRTAQKSGVNISPSLAAVAGAALVAVVVAFVLRPAQLAPHPAPESTTAPEHAHASVVERAQTLVYVAGAVVHPGVYALSGDARARDALAKAGGATHDADLVAVNLAAHVTDGDEIAVPRYGEEPAAPATRTAAHRTSPSTARRTRRRPRRTAEAADRAVADTPSVDLNSADAATLAELPGIGPTLAERIVEFRTLNGPFASVDGLADVAGITPQRLDTLMPLLTAGR